VLGIVLQSTVYKVELEMKSSHQDACGGSASGLHHTGAECFRLLTKAHKRDLRTELMGSVMGVYVSNNALDANASSLAKVHSAISD
jgi:hypothetical protein